MQPAGVIRAVLVDDQEVVRAGLRKILAQGGIDVVGELSDGALVCETVARLRADVVVMDMRMRNVDGEEAIRRLRAAAYAPPVLVLTTFDDDEVLQAALLAGASGFVLKEASGEEIIRATQAVAAGGSWLDPAVAGRVLRVYRAAAGQRSPDRCLDGLTSREMDVLRLVARGRSNDEIMRELGIGEATVKTHIGRLLAKLGLRDRAQVIVFAHEHGLAATALDQHGAT